MQTNNYIVEYKPSLFSKISVNGKVTFEDLLVIDGNFNGTIEGKEKSILQIDQFSTVEGAIYCFEVNIFGYVKGKITAQKVIIHENGSCNGEITCSQLIVHDNAKMDCKINTVWTTLTKTEPPALDP